MGQIDNELRDALQTAEAQGVSARDLPQPAVHPQPPRNVGLLMALLAAGIALLCLVAFVPLDGLRYATSPDALPAPEDAQPTKVYNLQGRLVSGSMQYRLNPCEFRFRVAGALKEVEVHYGACVLPDTVRDLKGKKVEITANGTLTSAGHFQARDVIGKCPSKDGYEADMGKRPELIEPTRID